MHAVHNSPQEQRGAGSRFWRPIASDISAPRIVFRPRWPVGCGGFLIANARLKISTPPTKQTIAAKSNRERIGFFSYDSSGHLSVIEIQSEISNRNSRLLEIHLNPAETILTHFLTATKPHIPAICQFRFLPTATFKHENSAPRRLSASRANRLESREKWQSPLKRLGRNQSLVKIS